MPSDHLRAEATALSTKDLILNDDLRWDWGGAIGIPTSMKKSVILQRVLRKSTYSDLTATRRSGQYSGSTGDGRTSTR